MEELGFLPALVDDVNLVAENDYRDAQVDFEDSFCEWHVETNVQFFSTHIRIHIVNVLKVFLPLDNQIAIVIELGFLPRLRVSLKLLLHFVEGAVCHIRVQFKKTSA